MTGVLDRLAAIIGADAFGRLGARELRTLLVLVAHTGRSGVAWPSVSRIASLAQVDVRHARRALAALEAKGLIRTDQPACGRRSARRTIAPSSVDGQIGSLLSGAEAAPDTKGAETAPATNVGGPFRRVAGAESAPLSGAESALRTHKEQTEHLGEAVPGSDQIAIQREIEWLTEHGIRHRNPFRCRNLVAGFLDAGGVRGDLQQLAREAAGRVGLLWHWLEDPHRWRAVVDDARLRRREQRAARRAQSARSMAP